MQKCDLNIHNFNDLMHFVGAPRVLRSASEILELIDAADSEISDLSSDDDAEPGKADVSDASANSSAESSTECESDDQDSDDEPLSNLTSNSTQWKRSDTFHPVVVAHDNFDNVDSRCDWEPANYVSEYLDRDLFKLLSVSTNVTSVAKTGKNINTSPEEIQTFIGACLFMSCVCYPRVRMFWQKGLAIPVLTDSMTRDRFFKIRSSLKAVVDIDISDEEKKVDRLWKVRPVINSVRSGCRKQTRSRDISIDEQMIPFTGACSLRQYVPNKPNPIGLKNFVAATPDGLVIDFVVYQGLTTFKAVPAELKLGIGGTVIAHLANNLPRGTHIYCDRYFTSPNLVQFMLSKEMYVTGTVMANRVSAIAKQLTSDKDLQRKGRGSCDLLVRQDHKMAAAKWFDNKPILMLSAIHGKEPEDDCSRWSKKDKTYVSVKRPAIIREYNANMGGVDLCDRMIAFYRMKTRTKKWTIRVMLHFIDLALVNAWIRYRKDKQLLKAPKKEVLQFLNFKLVIAQTYLAAINTAGSDADDDDDNDEPLSKRRKSVEIPAVPQRTSAAKHLPEMTDVTNSMRCRLNGCSGKSKVRCIACKVFLCMTSDRNCFLKFHKP